MQIRNQTLQTSRSTIDNLTNLVFNLITNAGSIWAESGMTMAHPFPFSSVFVWRQAMNIVSPYRGKPVWLVWKQATDIRICLILIFYHWGIYWSQAMKQNFSVCIVRLGVWRLEHKFSYSSIFKRLHSSSPSHIVQPSTWHINLLCLHNPFHNLIYSPFLSIQTVELKPVWCTSTRILKQKEIIINFLDKFYSLIKKYKVKSYSSSFLLLVDDTGLKIS